MRGLPVYEGYGLSENASVVAWNMPGRARSGTVGRPLPDCEVKLAPDGELLVKSRTLFMGYLGRDPSSCAIDDQGFLHTGDLAVQDGDGYLRILGRKKLLHLTGTGRNIDPRWVESLLLEQPGVQGALYHADRRVAPLALLVPTPGHPSTVLEAAVSAVNLRLPTFARIHHLHTPRLEDRSFHILFTRQGTPRRPLADRVIGHLTASSFIGRPQGNS